MHFTVRCILRYGKLSVTYLTVRKEVIMDDQNDITALNHQITDDEGKLIEEQTSSEDSAPPNEAPVEEAATAEKSVDEEIPPKEEPKSENDLSTDEPEMVETAADETGKRYVPESRFKEVYAKWKDAERKAKETGTKVPSEPIRPNQPIDKTDSLEIELLRGTLPQFNPESEEYSRDIDELGFSLYEGSKNNKGQYTMTRIDAGRKAVAMAKKITSKLVSAKTEARIVKAQQSDQGITSRVLNREPAKVDPEKMSLEDKEAWLKENGNW